MNLFCYCNNNPVMYSDWNGHAPKWWQGILIGVGVIAVAVAFFVTTGAGAPIGAAALKIGMDMLVSTSIIAATAGVTRVIKNCIEDEDNIEELGKDYCIGFGDGFLFGSILQSMSYTMFGLKLFPPITVPLTDIMKVPLLSYGKYSFLYGTTKKLGMTLYNYKGGVNGGSSFRIDFDTEFGYHFHSVNLDKKIKAKYNKTHSNTKGKNKEKNGKLHHNWHILDIISGIIIGLCPEYSEW